MTPPSLQIWGPVLALVGALVGATLGLYQWRKQYANPNRAANAAARREAYEGLWQKLEDINLGLRTRRDRNPKLFNELRDVNTYFIQHSLYFADEEQRSIDEYIRAMGRLREKVFASGDADVTSAFALTANPGFAARDQEILSAAEDVERLRKKIKKMIQRVAASE
jgi:hypothetical protein